MAQLRYPHEFSASMTRGFVTFMGVVAVGWVLVMLLYVGHRQGYVRLPVDKELALAGATTKAQKRRVKKFEDYWDSGSLGEDSSSHFPGRSATAAANISTFDDYWDDNFDFSTHSTDGLNLSRNL